MFQKWFVQTFLHQFFYQFLCVINGPEMGPDPTRAYFWPAVSKKLCLGYFLTQSEYIFVWPGGGKMEKFGIFIGNFPNPGPNQRCLAQSNPTWPKQHKIDQIQSGPITNMDPLFYNTEFSQTSIKGVMIKRSLSCWINVLKQNITKIQNIENKYTFLFYYLCRSLRAYMNQHFGLCHKQNSVDPVFIEMRPDPSLLLTRSK